MAEALGTLTTWNTKSSLVAKVVPGKVINKAAATYVPTHVKLDFSPKGSALTYVAGVTSYSPSNAWHVTVGVAITFTATTTTPAGVTVLEHKWDFGDGKVGYGSSVAHTFKYPGSVRVTLCVTDSRLIKSFASTIVYPQ